MKENLKKYMHLLSEYWKARTRSQKGIIIGSSIIVVLLLVGISFFATKKNFVPLYNNLSAQEIGQVKEELDAKGIPYEIDSGGTTINVPEKEVEPLLVDLASQGIPASGSIDYSFFSENASWGITDNEFNIMKLDAMQTELANLIKGIEGIEDAKVMINLPEETLFVNEQMEEASASIVLHTEAGYDFKGNQVETLHHLVAKAVPNLPEENIVIMNQYFEFFDANTPGSYGNNSDYTYQQAVKKDIEHDIQRRLQQMIGAMVGLDNVIVSVTSDVDFTEENRVEELIDPVDLDNMEGVPVSIETVHETYTGNQAAGGTAGTGEEDIAGYEGVAGDDDGEYELVKETINNEFNHIRKDIVESPFKIRDLGVQVAINNTVESEEDDVQFLTQQDQLAVEEGISSILNSIITTSIDKDYGEITPEEKVSIVFQEFNGKPTTGQPAGPTIPVWMYVVGGILLAIIIALIILLVRNRARDQDIVEEEDISVGVSEEIPDIQEGPETEADVRKKQLEKMAQEKPEEFAKLLRSWIADD